MDNEHIETETDETELDGDLAVDDETAAQVSGGVSAQLNRPHFEKHGEVKGRRI